MKVHVLAVVLAIASITPALAQTNKSTKTQRPKQAIMLLVDAPRTNASFGSARVVPVSLTCGPYVGGWLEGYPGTGRC
jgi:hypothetical protein